MLGGVGIGSGGKRLYGLYIGVDGRWVDGFVYWFCMSVKDAIEQFLILDVNGWLGFEFIIFIFYFSVFQFTASKLYLWLIISFILKMKMLSGGRVARGLRLFGLGGFCRVEGFSMVVGAWVVFWVALLFCWTKVCPFGNLVPEIASSQKGKRNLFPFEYLLPNTLYLASTF